MCLYHSQVFTESLFILSDVTTSDPFPTPPPRQDWSDPVPSGQTFHWDSFLTFLLPFRTTAIFIDTKSVIYVWDSTLVRTTRPLCRSRCAHLTCSPFTTLYFPWSRSSVSWNVRTIPDPPTKVYISLWGPPETRFCTVIVEWDLTTNPPTSFPLGDSRIILTDPSLNTLVSWTRLTSVPFQMEN